MARRGNQQFDDPSTDGPGAEARVAAEGQADELVQAFEQKGQFTGYSGAAGRHGTSGAQAGGFSETGLNNGGNQANDAEPDVQVVSLHDASGQDGPAFGSEANGAGDDQARRRRVEEAAYQRYQSRGNASGNAEQDWFDAEGDVDSETR